MTEKNRLIRVFIALPTHQRIQIQFDMGYYVKYSTLSNHEENKLFVEFLVKENLVEKFMEEMRQIERGELKFSNVQNQNASADDATKKK